MWKKFVGRSFVAPTLRVANSSLQTLRATLLKSPKKHGTHSGEGRGVIEGLDHAIEVNDILIKKAMRGEFPWTR